MSWLVTLDLTCTECDASFELDVQDLLDSPKTLVCPNCEAKAPARKVEGLASAMDDLIRSIKELAPKFSITVAAETEDVTSTAKGDDEDDDTEGDEDSDEYDDEDSAEESDD